MKVLNAVNVNTAYPKGINFLRDYGVRRESRNGTVLVAPEPVTTHYRNPCERVLFSSQRDANPFFHLFEALWMLTGAEDVALPKYFVSRMATFSDDGKTFHGAYGYRWRHAANEDVDQLDLIVEKLQENPDDRRVILQIWDVERDIGYDLESKDIPCNVMVKFEINIGGMCRCIEICPSERGLSCPGKRPQLNMIVFNRSNDIIWGCYGANVVQFSVLQEYLAARIGVAVGWYEQVSTNFHAYENVWNKYCPLTDIDPFVNQYDGIIQTEPIVTDVSSFDSECKQLIDYARKGNHTIGVFISEGYHNQFFHTVCNPMLWAYAYFRKGRLKEAIDIMETAILQSREIDWLVAGEQWLRRRAMNRLIEGEGI